MSETDSPLIVFQRSVRIGERRELRRFAAALHRDVAGGRPFSCLVTGDGEMRRLNQQFRGVDAATDVLSFPSASSRGPLGDIAISAERVRSQAASRRHSETAEACILMLHGLLHLLGMDHETGSGSMRRVESAWRRRLGLPPGLIERSRA